MGRSRASKDQMGIGCGVVPKRQPTYSNGGQTQPMQMGKAKDNRSADKPTMATTKKGERSH